MQTESLLQKKKHAMLFPERITEKWCVNVRCLCTTSIVLQVTFVYKRSGSSSCQHWKQRIPAQRGQWCRWWSDTKSTNTGTSKEHFIKNYLHVTAQGQSDLFHTLPVWIIMSCHSNLPFPLKTCSTSPSWSWLVLLLFCDLPVKSKYFTSIFLPILNFMDSPIISIKCSRWC